MGVIEPTKDQLAKKAWYIVKDHGGIEYYVKSLELHVVTWTRYKSQAVVFMTEAGAVHYLDTHFANRPEISAGNRVEIKA